MGDLKRKVRQLADAKWADAPCPECGSADGKVAPGVFDTVEVNVTWIDDDPDPQEEFCETCGAQTVFVIRWGGDDKDKEEQYD